MKKFFVVVLAAIITAASFFADVGIKSASAATSVSIYDYDVEYLIDYINKYLNDNFEVDTWGKSYFNYGKNNAPYCLMYVGDNKNQYIGFRLNSDRTVLYAYYGISDESIQKRSKDHRGQSIAAIGFGVGLKSSEITNLLEQALEYIEYYNKNNLDWSKLNKYFYKFCPSINKNVYLKIQYINNGKGFQMTVGATK